MSRPATLGSLLRPLILALGAAALLTAACAPAHVLHRSLRGPRSVEVADASSPYLKAHLRDGGVVLFHDWVLDEEAGLLRGTARHFSPERRLLEESFTNLPLDSAVLLETNTLVRTKHLPALQVMSGLYLAGSLLCLQHPKACFGSCPTFYTVDGGEPLLQAEGFSASVAPALEATDLDALCRPVWPSPEFRLEMRNEALETHAVRHADLLLVSRRHGGEVFQDSQGAFWEGTGLAAPLSVLPAAGKGLDALCHKDGVEWSETADPEDLGTRRQLVLEFPAPPEGPFGLAVCGRQSLLTTFVFYQALAWMGTRAGDCLAALERGDIPWDGGMGHLAEVRLSWWDGQRWQPAETFREVGPLALDEHVLRLPGDARPVEGRLRLRLDCTQGAWRWDRLALACLEPAGPPLRLSPAEVRRDGEADSSALAALLDPSRLLMTEPGDTYQLAYRLPSDRLEDALFLETRGWYLEWMREEWLAEEDPVRLARLLRRPERELKALAPAYKEMEPILDSLFWSSRYAR